MAFASTSALPRSLAILKTAPRIKRSFWSRLFDSIEQANMRRAEHEIGRYLGTHKFSDEAEREIARRFYGS